MSVRLPPNSPTPLMEVIIHPRVSLESTMMSDKVYAFRFFCVTAPVISVFSAHYKAVGVGK